MEVTASLVYFDKSISDCVSSATSWACLFCSGSAVQSQ